VGRWVGVVVVGRWMGGGGAAQGDPGLCTAATRASPRLPKRCCAGDALHAFELLLALNKLNFSKLRQLHKAAREDEDPELQGGPLLRGWSVGGVGGGWVGGWGGWGGGCHAVCHWCECRTGAFGVCK
jgi:hypothetical protein